MSEGFFFLRRLRMLQREASALKLFLGRNFLLGAFRRGPALDGHRHFLRFPFLSLDVLRGTIVLEPPFRVEPQPLIRRPLDPYAVAGFLTFDPKMFVDLFNNLLILQ